MNKLIGREPLSVQLANIIEKDIFSGGLPPDSPLASTRELARNFGVSHQVVISALDILEQKDLIVRLPRKGVFVKASSIHPKAREVLFFAFADQPESHTMLMGVHDLITNPLAQGRYDFSTRIVGSGNIDTSGRLDREIARLAHWGFIDCAIIYTSSFSAEDIRKCVKLPYPVIFVGDLPRGDFGDLKFMQLAPENQNSANLVMEYAARGNYDEIVLVYGDKSGTHDYPSLITGRMDYLAAELGVNLRKIIIPGVKLRQVQDNFKKSATDIVNGCHGKTLFVTYEIRSREYNDMKMFKPRDYPHIEFMTMDSFSAQNGITYIRRDYKEYQRKLCELIDSTSGGPPEYRKVLVKFSTEVVSSIKQG